MTNLLATDEDRLRVELSLMLEYFFKRMLKVIGAFWFGQFEKIELFSKKLGLSSWGVTIKTNIYMLLKIIISNSLVIFSTHFFYSAFPHNWKSHTITFLWVCVLTLYVNWSKIINLFTFWEFHFFNVHRYRQTANFYKISIYWETILILHRYLSHDLTRSGSLLHWSHL